MLRGRASGSFSAGRKKRVKQGWLKIKRVQKSRKPKGNEWWKKKQEKREREGGKRGKEGRIAKRHERLRRGVTCRIGTRRPLSRNFARRRLLYSFTSLHFTRSLVHTPSLSICLSLSSSKSLCPWLRHPGPGMLRRKRRLLSGLLLSSTRLRR